ncbi:cytochrome b [Acetobacter oeni]|uniref:Cytochrome b n=1 Tax=Acetobacter oeni TaxID=304077 RepID=A0A511XQG1_9PROT|nr:cytochrome b [Acetobacter oeni]MBB3884794.1 cytochrome b561 [Acetobacter oeni]NHO20744.1 cytochrome b [Acetobacter oeni]GBR09053.1 cytochrome B561 [Acetobacter oeni LMG 21952]GEN65149.1 cytochrome b [Acetobacter oeni]
MSCEKSFSLPSRVLHWLMAVMILAMLFIGVFLASTVGPDYNWLLTLHRSLGIAVLVLALVRLANRFCFPPPPLPDELPPIIKTGARASHILLYALMIAMPLVGWGMLSAGGYPVPLWGQSVLLPSILPHDPALWAWLRSAHTLLAFLLFGLVLLHIGAALFHGLIRRDSVLQSMTWQAGHDRK